MLDMSWGEVMLIGGVALIVIGPKDLPKALRTLGQITTKVRRMAGEFQHQFSEAIREADLEEIKREVDGVRSKAESFRPSFNPVDTIRTELRNAVDGRSGPAAAGPRLDASDPLASTSPAAIASTQVDRAETPVDDAVGAGTYDVPRIVEPRATGTLPHEPKPVVEAPYADKPADGRVS